MATLNRIEPAYSSWTSAASTLARREVEEEEYVGRHRKPEGRRRWSMFAFFYRARHRR